MASLRASGLIALCHSARPKAPRNPESPSVVKLNSTMILSISTAALEGALRLVYAAIVDRCPDNAGRAMAIFVRCIDNTSAADVLVVGDTIGPIRMPLRSDQLRQVRRAAI